MTAMPPAKPKRERGDILTPQGWRKLQRAKQVVEAESNWGRRLTREQLSDRTGLSLHTIFRILQRQERVDRQSLECFFHAFSLELSLEDCAVNDSLASVWAFGQEDRHQDWGEAIDVSTFGHTRWKCGTARLNRRELISNSTMKCPLCGHEKSHKHGKTSSCCQRYFCPKCQQTFTDT
jgi:hypothetical protein